MSDRLPVGIIYETEKPIYHRELYGDWNPVIKRKSIEERRDAVERLLKGR